MPNSKSLYSVASAAASSAGDYEVERIGIQESLRDIDFEKRNLDLTLSKISATTDTIAKGLEYAGTLAVGMEDTAAFKESIPFAEKQLQEIHGTPDVELEQIKRGRLQTAIDYLTGTPAKYKFGDITFSGQDEIAELKALGKFGKYKNMYNQTFPESPNVDTKNNVLSLPLKDKKIAKTDAFRFEDVNIVPQSDIKKTDKYGFSIDSSDSSQSKITSYEQYVKKHGEPSNAIKAMFGIDEPDEFDLDSMWDDVDWEEVGNYQDYNQSQPGNNYYIQQTGLHKRG